MKRKRHYELLGVMPCPNCGKPIKDRRINMPRKNPIRIRCPNCRFRVMLGKEEKPQERT